MANGQNATVAVGALQGASAGLAAIPVVGGIFAGLTGAAAGALATKNAENNPAPAAAAPVGFSEWISTPAHLAWACVAAVLLILAYEGKHS